MTWTVYLPGDRIAAVLRSLARTVRAAWYRHRRAFERDAVYRALVAMLAEILLCELSPAIAWTALLDLLDQIIRHAAA